jgi:hypothetical protein
MNNGGSGGCKNGRNDVTTAVTAAVTTAVMTVVTLALLVVTPSALPSQTAPERLDRSRFTFLFFASDRQLASSLAAHAIATDTFPGMPRPTQRVIIAIAPDRQRFREWVGNASPEWGSAVAFPATRRIVMQGRNAGSDAGNPLVVLRHELAHLALHEYLGELAPRWFDEGYASYSAAEWGREEVLMTNLALALRGMPTLEELEASFGGGATAAQSAYALAYRAVVELAVLNPNGGLTQFFTYWKQTRSMERAMRRAYGMTTTDFERRWRTRTRTQYGVLALVSNVTIGALLLLFVLTPLYLARRRRDRLRLENMRAADAAAEAAARESAINELLGPPAPEDDRP